MIQQAKIQIFGRVQGVFYRSEAKELADSLGLSGWIKNEKDGSISIYVQGSSDALNKFMDWCRVGPAGAEVNDLKCQFETLPQEKLEDFVIKY